MLLKNKIITIISICFVTISIGLILSSCNAGTNSLNNVNHVNPAIKAKIKLKSDENTLPYTMGGTYDTTTGYTTTATSCLNAGVAGNFMISSPKAIINLSETQSLDEVLNALGINMAVTVGWGEFAVTTNYNYANSSQDDAYTLNFNYIYKYSGTATFPNSVNMQGESALTTSAQAVLGLPMQFRTMCGDRYVAQLDAGASVLMKLQLHFWSEEDKNYFDAHLKKVKGLDNVLALIAANTGDTRYTLTASGIQVGGNPTLLDNIFINAGGSVNPSDGYPSITCSTGHGIAASCADLVNNIISYTATIESQLASPTDFYYSNPVTAKWSTLGIKAGDVSPNEAVLSAIQNISNLYNKDQDSIRFLINYSNMLENNNLLSPSMNQNIMNLYSLVQQILSIYSDLGIMNCYDGFASTQCVAINSSLVSQRNQIITSNQDLFNLLSYIENNQYTSKLLIGSNLNDTAYCGLYPISSSERALFLINCNGQVSGSIGTDSGTQIIVNTNNTLTVNNFNYSYTAESSTENNFGAVEF